MEKLLVIRFSSLGDIAHVMPTIATVKSNFPTCEVHWLTRSDFTQIVSLHQDVDQVISFEKKLGLYGLLCLVIKLSKNNYSHIYDAHNNVRSNIVFYLLRILSLKSKKIQRSKNRLKRFALFKLRKNFFPQPYKAAQTFLDPIRSWLPQNSSIKPTPVVSTILPMSLPPKYICISPSAAWPKKRWPIKYWIELINNIDCQVVILGGPSDEFCHDIAASAPQKTHNLSGKTSWPETLSVIQKSICLVSGDTGALHLADMINHPNIGLIGPTAFGYTSQVNSKILEVELPCKPCDKDGRGPCSNSVYQKCLIDITPAMVVQKLKNEFLK